MVRRLVLPLAILCALGAVMPAAGSAKKKPRPAACSAKRSISVLVNVESRVYETTNGDDHKLFGCRYRNRKARLLDTWTNSGESRGDEPPPEAWLSGHVVALNTWDCPPDGSGSPCTGGLKVVDLANGHVLHAANTGGSVTDLVLRPNGSTAFFASGGLHRLDPTGDTVLDPGPIVSGSLALGGTTVYWTKDGAPHSAPIN